MTGGSQAAISVCALGKRYTLGERARYFTLRDSIASLGGRFRRGPVKEAAPQIWALKDLSFDVHPGEVVGVIGRNGAGKSTLLKILSRITDPTEGTAVIRGRLGSLLEVGTGFHPELTGRENILLNGAILGMTNREIASLFDQIVAFAEVERFVDTPVKRYSSGMYVRLAFAVAAHLRADILLVDEVLAVGDIAFQRKCLGKMHDLAGQGRTVLFVSHNIAAVNDLCARTIVLDNGRITFDGSVAGGIAAYSVAADAATSDATRTSDGLGPVRINGSLGGMQPVAVGAALTVETSLDPPGGILWGWFICIVDDGLGRRVLHQRIDSRALGLVAMPRGWYSISLEIPGLWLAPGTYLLHISFLGRGMVGDDVRFKSERVILSVTGDVEGIGHAALAPPTAWMINHGDLTVRGVTNPSSFSASSVRDG